MFMMETVYGIRYESLRTAYIHINYQHMHTQSSIAKDAGVCLSLLSQVIENDMDLDYTPAAAVTAIMRNLPP